MRNVQIIGAIVLTLSMFVLTTNASLLDKINAKADELTNKIAGFCLTNEGCNRDILEIKNYCCLKRAQCCDVFSYTFQNE